MINRFQFYRTSSEFYFKPYAFRIEGYWEIGWGYWVFTYTNIKD